MKFFNTAGPCIEGMHYMLPPLDRIPEARGLVDRGAYFVVHAPRQSGKTTALRALAKALTEEGRYAALAFSSETAADNGVMTADIRYSVTRPRLTRDAHICGPAPHSSKILYLIPEKKVLGSDRHTTSGVRAIYWAQHVAVLWQALRSRTGFFSGIISEVLTPIPIG